MRIERAEHAGNGTPKNHIVRLHSVGEVCLHRFENLRELPDARVHIGVGLRRKAKVNGEPEDNQQNNLQTPPRGGHFSILGLSNSTNSSASGKAQNVLAGWREYQGQKSNQSTAKSGYAVCDAARKRKVSIEIRSPSVRTVINPSRSVRKTVARCPASLSSTLGCG